jgi:hypothetical protein
MQAGGEPAPPAAPLSTARAWFGRRRRKRVAAREVDATTDTTAAAAVMATSESVVDPPEAPPATLPESVLDPTLLGERHRKHSQNFAYRLTQAAALLSLLAACGALLSVLLEDVVPGRVLAGGACALAVASVGLVKRSRLAYRMRGYAAAFSVLAAIAMTVSLIVTAPPEENKAAGGEDAATTTTTTTSKAATTTKSP